MPVKDWITQLFRRIVATYRLNGKFHALVIAVEFAAIGFLTTYQGGLPATHDAWSALISGLVGAVWGAVKGWLRANVTQPEGAVELPSIDNERDYDSSVGG
jgi:hypothetical protein